MTEPADWRKLVIIAAPQADGTWAGSISIGGTTGELRGWIKTSGGILKGEVRFETDPLLQWADQAGKVLTA